MFPCHVHFHSSLMHPLSTLSRLECTLLWHVYAVIYSMRELVFLACRHWIFCVLPIMNGINTYYMCELYVIVIQCNFTYSL